MAFSCTFSERRLDEQRIRPSTGSDQVQREALRDLRTLGSWQSQRSLITFGDEPCQEGAGLLTGPRRAMDKSKTAPTLKPLEAVDWTGVRLQRVEHEPAAKILAQGDPATSVMYVEKGAVRLSVLSHAGKEAVLSPSPLIC